MVNQVTFYSHKDCGFCADLLPLVKKAAKSKGLKFVEVDIEECETKFCDNLQFVPTIVLNSKKLNVKQVEKFLDS